MSLPIQWIDRIFEKIGLVYGQDFLSRLKGMPNMKVKANWAHELAGLDSHPEAIAWALDHLPTDRPPNVLQFRELCSRAPSPERPKLSEPKADRGRVLSEIARLKASLAQDGVKASPTEWAHRILAQEAVGVPKTQTVLAMARAVAVRHPRRGD